MLHLSSTHCFKYLGMAAPYLNSFRNGFGLAAIPNSTPMVQISTDRYTHFVRASSSSYRTIYRPLPLSLKPLLIQILLLMGLLFNLVSILYRWGFLPPPPLAIFASRYQDFGNYVKFASKHLVLLWYQQFLLSRIHFLSLIFASNS